MPIYFYKAIDSDGNMFTSSMEADNIKAFYEQANSSNINVINVKESNTLTAKLVSGYGFGTVRRIEIIEFARNLAIMLKAGMPILTALEDIGLTTTNKFFKNIIGNVRLQINQGASLSHALENTKRVFPDIFKRLVKVGEETGNLEKSLNDIADHLQRMADLIAAIKRALLYPIFAFVATTGALLFWLIYVLPKIIVIFKDLGVALPPITVFLIAASDFTVNYWYIILISPLIIYCLYKLARKHPAATYKIDLAMIKMPIIKLIVYNKLLALFAEQMRILITAGIPINRSLELIQETIGNEVFRKSLKQIHFNIMAGSGLSESIKEHKIFPILIIRMIAVGEISGTLETQFNFLSEHYLKIVDDISDKMGKIIEPVVLLFVGAMFALIISGLMLPIYDLVTKIGSV
ncbi:MAG: type II secretion system F family protein [Candidatus Magnetoovum sp. WYHC-5]|nr:type II secretion system F family protein [Candidatus Magnetoovum sp. WYHC-5]